MTEAPSSRDASEDLDDYERLATEWDQAQGDAKKANRIFDQLHALARKMRESAEGRDALESLLNHPLRGVRMKVAGECLAWAPERAMAVLEALRDPRGTHSLSADYTLREYRAGNLRFDW